MTLLMMQYVILLSKLTIRLYSKFGQLSDLWQQLEVASELESDLRDTMDWDKMWLGDFSARKTQLVSCDQSNKTILLM